MKAKTTFTAFDGRVFASEADCLAHEKEVAEISNTQWKHSYFFRTELRKEFHSVTMDCPTCGGTGVVGGGFKSMDGPQTCSHCWGSGSVTDTANSPTVAPAPPLPDGLRDHMQAAWLSFWEKAKP